MKVIISQYKFLNKQWSGRWFETPRGQYDRNGICVRWYMKMMATDNDYEGDGDDDYNGDDDEISSVVRVVTSRNSYRLTP